MISVSMDPYVTPDEDEEVSGPQFIFESYSSEDEVYEQEEDSNAEDHPANDYPDEEDFEEEEDEESPPGSDYGDSIDEGYEELSSSDESEEENWTYERGRG